MMMLMFPLVFLIHSSLALVGYDCGSSRLNITTISLSEVGECNLPESSVNISERHIQLLQINEYTEATVFQCKIEIHRTVYNCGAYSHSSVVLNGEMDFLRHVSKDACLELHKLGIFKVDDSHIIRGVSINNTETRSIIYAGTTDDDGDCTGAPYSDPYGTWEKVLVQGTIKITLSEQIARVNLNNGKIHLSSGTVCPLIAGKCIDSAGGYSFWDPVPPLDNCKFNQYGVLYSGLANKIIDNTDLEQIIYTVTTEDVTFALTVKGEQNICGYKIIRTEHPKLLIFENVNGEIFTKKSDISVSNLDIFNYVNSKFIYVEKHIRNQLKQLYDDVITQKCNLEKQTIKNSLSLATLAPDQFAFDFMKGPGYMAVIAGEVVHIVKCLPVEVKIDNDEYCYSELRVQRLNQTLFLKPRTHILQSKGTRMPCNKALPSYYLIENNWVKMMPDPVEVPAPQKILPGTKASWKYQNPSALATSGIYKQRDLDQIKERIMFPIEKPTVLNDLAREMRGHHMVGDEGTIGSILNVHSVKKIMENTWSRMWAKFISFGTASAGFITLLIIFHAVKYSIDVSIQGYALHSVYGWSIHLLGAIWTSVTHFLLHLGKTTTTTPNHGMTLNAELEEIRVSTSTKNQSQTVPSAPISNEEKGRMSLYNFN